MSRPLSPSFVARSITVAAAMLFSFLVADPARAGIGDVMKKAKDKASQALKKKAPEPPGPGQKDKVVFDDTIVELTGERLDHILAAFEAGKAAGTGRPALVEKRNRASDRRREILQKNEEAIRTTRDRRNEAETCYRDGYQEAQDRRNDEYKQKALSDPAVREKYMKATQEYAAAAARGDSAAAARINETMMREILPTRGDSAEVRRKCGSVPPRLPAEIQLDDLDQQIAALDEQIRKIDEKVAETQAKQGGLDRRQWAMALERIQLYLSAKDAKAAPRGFTPAELDAMEKRIEQLRAVLG